MSNLRTKRIQLGDHVTPSNNFVIRQPDTPDGSMKIGYGSVDSSNDLIDIFSSDGGVLRTNLLQVRNASAPSGWEATSTPTLASDASGQFSIANGGDKRFSINTDGHVTMPNQPAFDAGLTSGEIGPTNTVLFNNVRLNQGNHYSSSTGRFTAPINGVYEFYWGGIKNSTSSVTRAVLRRNGTAVRENRLAEGDTYHSACWIMLLELNASDYVDIEITAGSFYGSSDFYGNAFGGRLVG